MSPSYKGMITAATRGCWAGIGAYCRILDVVCGVPQYLCTDCKGSPLVNTCDDIRKVL